MADQSRPPIHNRSAVSCTRPIMGGPGHSMRRDELLFERPTDLFASSPPELRGLSRDDVRLMVSTPDGKNSHHRFRELPDLLNPGDLLVVNESMTLPASLPAVSRRFGNIRLNLSTRFSEYLWVTEPRWSPGQPGPIALEEGENLMVDGSSAKLLMRYPGIPRLWLVRFAQPASILMMRIGEPIHYGYASAHPIETDQNFFFRISG